MRAVIAENLFERAIFNPNPVLLEASTQNTQAKLNLTSDINTIHVINSTTHTTKGCV